MTKNTLYPGRPGYVGPRTGIFLLLHHDQLCEQSHDVLERVKYVRNNKPANEVKARLWQMCRVPEEHLPKRLAKAYAELDKACAECNKAYAGFNKARAEYNKARADWDKAYDEWDKAYAEFNKAYAEWDDKEIVKILNMLVPDNTWNGSEILF